MKTYTGKNLEDAIQNAANDKQVTAEELTYTVIEETSGFLGLGSKDVYKRQILYWLLSLNYNTYVLNISLFLDIHPLFHNIQGYDRYHPNVD